MPSRSPAPGLSQALRPERIHAAALEVLALVLEEGRLADRALAQVLRRERSLFSGERRAVAEAIYGLLRREQALRSGLARALEGATLRDFPASEIHAALLMGHFELEDTPVSLPVSRKLQRAVRGLRAAVKAEVGDRPGAAGIALRHSLPEWLARELSAEIGEAETDALFGALNQRAPLTLRTNTLKGTREALLAELTALGHAARPTPLSPWGITLDDNPNMFALPPFKAGKFEVQDEGSQLLALLCRARPGQIVIDGCAGGGGKALALAAEMRNKGELWALDSNAKRLTQLKPRARRAGAHNIRSAVIAAEGPFPPAIERLRGTAQIVLIDAPCSGIGALRRNPDARRRLTPESIADQARIQLAILRRLSTLVRPGGLLVYATCSVLRAEDEAIVGAFRTESGFAPVPVSELLGPALAAAIDAPLAERPALRAPNALRLWPHLHGTDGFFAAGLRAP